jgi:hypothetical protein
MSVLRNWIAWNLFHLALTPLPVLREWNFLKVMILLGISQVHSRYLPILSTQLAYQRTPLAKNQKSHSLHPMKIPLICRGQPFYLLFFTFWLTLTPNLGFSFLLPAMHQSMCRRFTLANDCHRRHRLLRRASSQEAGSRHAVKDEPRSKSLKESSHLSSPTVIATIYLIRPPSRTTTPLWTLSTNQLHRQLQRGAGGAS